MKLARTAAAFLLLAGTALAPAVYAPSAQAAVTLKGKPKIAFIFFGTTGDGGWDTAQNDARLALQTAYHQKIPYVESVPETSAKVEQAVDLFLSHGANIIISGSYGYSDALAAEAKAHPDVAFVNMAGNSSAPNLESSYARTYQGWYLAGMAAGYKTKTKTLGLIEAFPIPNVVWDADAFALGAKAANPGTVVKVAYVNAWSDPVKEAQISQAMIGQGADVIATDNDTAAAIVVADKAGKNSVGYQVDMAKSAPAGILTSVVFHWKAILVPMVGQMIAGKWTPKADPLYGIDSGAIDITPLMHLPADQAAKVTQARADLASGKLDVFAGPIKAQDGTVKVAAGKTASDDDLWGINYLVDNIQGSMK